MKKEIGIIAILLVGIFPTVLFTSTLSFPVASGRNSYGVYIEVMDITLDNRNPLLRNQYIFVAGKEFTSYEGWVDGSFSFYNKDTMVNTTINYRIDATSPYISSAWGSGVFTLPPGEYILTYYSSVSNIPFTIYAKGWLATQSDILGEIVDGWQYVVIFICVIFLIYMITVAKKVLAK